MPRFLLLLLFSLCCLVILPTAISPPAAAAPLDEPPPYVTTTSLAPDPVQAFDRFGQTVVLGGDGNLLVVGAPLRDVGGKSDQGAVFIFRQDSTGWSLEKMLVAGDGQAGDRFGAALALAGPTDNVLLIGAPDADRASHTSLGAAYLFTYTGSDWSLAANLDPVDPDAFSYDKRGSGVALSDDGQIAFVGAPGVEGPSGTTPGAVYVFTGTGGWALATRITGPTSAAAGMGLALAASGSGSDVTLFAAGVYSESGPIINRGTVHVYEGSGSTWSKTAALIPSAGTEDDEFGAALASSAAGDRLLVGSPRFAGNAYLFTRSGSSWNEVAHFTPPLAYGHFGHGVALARDGTLAAIGAPLNGSGAVHLYSEEPGGGWMLAQTVRIWHDNSGIRLGAAVAMDLSGDLLVAGAPESDFANAPVRGAMRSAAGGALYVYVPGTELFLPLLRQ